MGAQHVLDIASSNVNTEYQNRGLTRLLQALRSIRFLQPRNGLKELFGLYTLPAVLLMSGEGKGTPTGAFPPMATCHEVR
jgi:hypothetical protein